MGNGEKSKVQPVYKSKLFKLKEWLTVPEAAKYLTTIFGEEVTEADVLRLALDRHLKLSVYFVNYADAKCGDKFLPFEEWERNFNREISWEELRPIHTADGHLCLTVDHHDIYFPVSLERVKDQSLLNPPKEVRKNLAYELELKEAFWNELSSEEQSAFLRVIPESIIDFARRQAEIYGRVPPGLMSFKGEVKSMEGVWDLPMIGAERIDVEHKYQQLTDGPEVTLTHFDGAFVEGQDHAVWQLQYRFEDETYQFEQGLNAADANIKDSREEKKKRPFRHPSNYFPANALPDDSVFVVRTSALLDMQERLTKEPTIVQKTDPRTEKSNLHIIGAMLQIIMDKEAFNSEEELRKHIAEKYAGFSGCTERTMGGRFAEAKKLLSE